MSDGIKMAITEAMERLSVNRKSAAPKPKPTPTRKNGGNRARRSCPQCRQELAVQAFRAGHPACRKCEAAQAAKSAKKLDPGIKIVRCRECGKGFPQSQTNGYCERCAKEVAR